ncbi:MAG: hypothetical protein AABY22_12695 [Nanoarchaeota archaeon]
MLSNKEKFVKHIAALTELYVNRKISESDFIEKLNDITCSPAKAFIDYLLSEGINNFNENRYQELSGKSFMDIKSLTFDEQHEFYELKRSRLEITDKLHNNFTAAFIEKDVANETQDSDALKYTFRRWNSLAGLAENDKGRNNNGENS